MVKLNQIIKVQQVKYHPKSDANDQAEGLQDRHLYTCKIMSIKAGRSCILMQFMKYRICFWCE